jgi:hypothetical protein
MAIKIEYIGPLSRGISRMWRDLFTPFDLKKWFVVGFAAFLAGLVEFRFSGGANLGLRRRPEINLEEVLYFPQHIWEILTTRPLLAVTVSLGAAVFCVISVIVIWISSRGKFVFLDNVVRGQSGIVFAWHEYRKEANSFFLWNLLFASVSLALIVIYLAAVLFFMQALYEISHSARALFIPALFSGLGLIVIALFLSFLYVPLRDFVVLVMYRDRIMTWNALQTLLPLFRAHVSYFIGYVLFLFVLLLAVSIGMIIFGCVTCCVGFIVLVIPYINAVVLLPVSYTIRAFSIEFLEQFGIGRPTFPGPDSTFSDTQEGPNEGIDHGSAPGHPYRSK